MADEQKDLKDQRMTSSLGEIINANISGFQRKFDGIPESIELAGSPLPDEQTEHENQRQAGKKRLKHIAVFEAMKNPETMFMVDYDGIDGEVITTLKKTREQFNDYGYTTLFGKTYTSEKKLYKMQLFVLNDCMKNAGYPWHERPHFSFLGKMIASAIRFVKYIQDKTYRKNVNAIRDKINNIVYVDPETYNRELKAQRESEDKGITHDGGEHLMDGPELPVPPLMPNTAEITDKIATSPIKLPPLPPKEGLIEDSPENIQDEGADVIEEKELSNQDIVNENPENIEENEPNADEITEEETAQDKEQKSAQKLEKRQKTYSFLIKKMDSYYKQHKDKYPDFDTAREEIMIECLKENPKFLISNIESLPRVELYNNERLAKFAIDAEMNNIKNSKYFNQYHPLEQYAIPMNEDGTPDKSSRNYKRYEGDLFKEAIRRLPSVARHYMDKDMNTLAKIVLASPETMTYMLPGIAQMNDHQPMMRPDGRVWFKDEFIQAMGEAFGTNIQNEKNADKMLNAAEKRFNNFCNPKYNTFGYDEESMKTVQNTGFLIQNLVMDLRDDTVSGIVNRALDRTSPVLLHLPMVKDYFRMEENLPSLVNAVQELNTPMMEEDFGNIYGWKEKRAFVTEMSNDLIQEKQTVHQEAQEMSGSVNEQQALNNAAALIDAASTERCNLDRKAIDYIQKESEIIKKLAVDLYGTVNQETYMMAKNALYQEDAKDLDVTITDTNENIEEKEESEVSVGTQPSVRTAQPRSLNEKLQNTNTVHSHSDTIIEEDRTI